MTIHTPSGTGRAPFIAVGLGQRAVERVRDLVRIAGENLGHSEGVIEADEDVRGDEPALGEVAAGIGERHRRLERSPSQIIRSINVPSPSR